LGGFRDRNDARSARREERRGERPPFWQLAPPERAGPPVRQAPLERLGVDDARVLTVVSDWRAPARRGDGAGKAGPTEN
jgi:hypothetical protein